MAWKETLLFYKQSPYQRINFFTEADGSFSLTLNDYWQFNSACEHIYHECLFTLPALLPSKLETALVLGGGDGLGARELLKFNTLNKIDLIDLDPEIVKFAKTNVFMKSLNKDSFNNPRVKLNVTDAKKWLEQPATHKYDLIIIDFPDPTSDDLWDLFTEKLYKQVLNRLTPDGVVSVQSSTYNTRTFELIYERLNKVFPYIAGYHTGASSVFCGFFLCSRQPVKINRPIPSDCRWINPARINQLLGLPLFELKTKKRKPVALPQKGSLRRPGNLTGLGAFGKGAMVPAPTAPPENSVAPVETPAAVAAMQNIAAGTEEAVESEELSPMAPAELETQMSSSFSNPLILGGIGLVIAVPMLIFLIR